MVIKSIWWFFLFLALIPLAKYAASLYRENQLRSCGIHQIDTMGGHVFEERLKVLFKDLGYRVTHTGKNGSDYGADLVIQQNNMRTVVQAKRYRKKVGVSAIQQIVAAKDYYRATNAMVVTNSFYTAPATKLAGANNVTLWDRNKLIHELIALEKRRNTKSLRIQ